MQAALTAIAIHGAVERHVSGAGRTRRAGVRRTPTTRRIAGTAKTASYALSVKGRKPVTNHAKPTATRQNNAKRRLGR